MTPKPSGPRRSILARDRVAKTERGHDIWEKPNGSRLVIRAGVEPLVPVRREEVPTEADALTSFAE